MTGHPLLFWILIVATFASALGWAFVRNVAWNVLSRIVLVASVVGLLLLVTGLYDSLPSLLYDLLTSLSGKQLLFWVFALTTCGGAIAVVLTQNVVRMAFWLIVSLGASAGLFFLLNADFVGTAQLLVYVGGTLVLLVFGVMLTASGPFSKMQTRPGELVLAGIIALLLLGLLWSSVCSVEWDHVVAATNGGAPLTDHQALNQGFNRPEEGNTGRPLGMAFLGMRPDRDLVAGNKTLSTGYLLPFEIASVHLLVVLIGAAYLARAKRRVHPIES